MKRINIALTDKEYEKFLALEIGATDCFRRGMESSIVIPMLKKITELVQVRNHNDSIGGQTKSPEEPKLVLDNRVPIPNLPKTQAEKLAIINGLSNKFVRQYICNYCGKTTGDPKRANDGKNYCLDCSVLLNAQDES